MNNDALSFLTSDVESAARALLGGTLVRTIDGNNIRVKIVEVEAYDQTDAASHSYKGRTPRTDIMFGPAGHLYVYFTYGMHYCCNIVVGQKGVGAAILIRAVEPLEGVAAMQERRAVRGTAISNGPAKLCQALEIDKRLNDHDLTKSPLILIPGTPLRSSQITQTTRIGISQAKEVAWRFYITGNPFVSKL